MTPRLLTGRKGLDPQAAFLAVLIIALTVATLSLLLQPSNKVAGQDGDCPTDEALTEGLKVCLLEPELKLESGSTNQKVYVTVTVNRGIDTSDRPGPEEDDPDMVKLRENMTCDDDVPCIRGGIQILDSYNDAEEGTFADVMVAFAIRDGDDPPVEYTSYLVCDDLINNPERVVEVLINTAFSVERYGYEIVERTRKISVGNRDEGSKPCADISVDPTVLTVNEGDTEGEYYEVKLNSQPRHPVNVNITVEGDEQITIERNGTSVTSLEFPTANWDEAQTIKVTAEEDDSDVTDDTVTIKHSPVSSDHEYNSLDTVFVKVIIKDNDAPPGVKLSTTSLTIDEGRLDSYPSSATYTVVLDSQPTDNVVIKIEANGDLMVSKDGVTFNEMIELIFTNMNWNMPQVITVRAGQDLDYTDDRNVSITHIIDANNSADEYDNIQVPSVIVRVEDDDTRPPDPPTSTFTPTPTHTPTPTNTPTPTQSNSGGGAALAAESHLGQSCNRLHLLLHPNLRRSRRIGTAATRTVAPVPPAVAPVPPAVAPVPPAVAPVPPAVAAAAREGAPRTSPARQAIRGSSRTSLACWRLSRSSRPLRRQPPRRHPRRCQP